MACLSLTSGTFDALPFGSGPPPSSSFCGRRKRHELAGRVPVLCPDQNPSIYYKASRPKTERSRTSARPSWRIDEPSRQPGPKDNEMLKMRPRNDLSPGRATSWSRDLPGFRRPLQGHARHGTGSRHGLNPTALGTGAAQSRGIRFPPRLAYCGVAGESLWRIKRPPAGRWPA
jgi:hypothetical protein